MASLVDAKQHIYRLGDDFIPILADLSVALAPEGGSPLPEVEVVRIVLRRAHAEATKRNPKNPRTRG